MSKSYSSGLNFTWPTRGEINWETVVDIALAAISAHDHTGSGKGLAIGASAIADNSMNDLKVRLRNNQYLRSLNAAGSGDINIVKVNTSNLVEFAVAMILNGSVTLGADLLFSADNTVTIGALAQALKKLYLKQNSWVPVVTGGGSMTILTSTIHYAKYWYTTGKGIQFSVGFSATFDGAANRQVNITGPSTVADLGGSHEQGGAGTFYIDTVPTRNPCSWHMDPASSPTLIKIHRYDYAVWALGAAHDFAINGFIVEA